MQNAPSMTIWGKKTEQRNQDCEISSDSELFENSQSSENSNSASQTSKEDSDSFQKLSPVA